MKSVVVDQNRERESRSDQIRIDLKIYCELLYVAVITSDCKGVINKSNHPSQNPSLLVTLSISLINKPSFPSTASLRPKAFSCLSRFFFRSLFYHFLKLTVRHFVWEFYVQSYAIRGLAISLCICYSYERHSNFPNVVCS
jgi:hypothetical protein